MDLATGVEAAAPLSRLVPILDKTLVCDLPGHYPSLVNYNLIAQALKLLDRKFVPVILTQG